MPVAAADPRLVNSMSKVRLEPTTACASGVTLRSNTADGRPRRTGPGAGGIVAGPGSAARTFVLAQWLDRSPPAPVTSTQWATSPWLRGAKSRFDDLLLPRGQVAQPPLQAAALDHRGGIGLEESQPLGDFFAGHDIPGGQIARVADLDAIGDRFADRRRGGPHLANSQRRGRPGDQHAALANHQPLAARIGRAEDLDADLVRAGRGILLDDLHARLAGLIGQRLDPGRARRAKNGRRTASSFITHDPTWARAVIALPPDGRGQRLLAAGGDDGRGGEAKLGIDPIDRRRLGTFGGKDHVGSDERHLADAFDRRTDRNPALSGGNRDIVARSAGPLGTRVVLPTANVGETTRGSVKSPTRKSAKLFWPMAVNRPTLPGRSHHSRRRLVRR